MLLWPKGLTVKKLKELYVGKLYIYDLTSKKVLIEGHGTFDVKTRQMNTLFNNDQVYQNISWLPILETEDGYFSPAQTLTSDIISFGLGFLPSSNRRTFGMDNYFHWKLAHGLDFIASTYPSIAIDIATTANESMTIQSKQSAVKANAESKLGLISEEKYKGYLVKTSHHFSTKSYHINQYTRIEITPPNEHPFTMSDWLPIVHAFRLFWSLRLDKFDCQVTDFTFDNGLSLHTDLTTFKAFTDNTYTTEDRIYIETAIDNLALAKAAHFFLKNDDSRAHAKIEHAFYNYMKVRFGVGPKAIKDEVLSIVFALDGFSSAVAKGAKNDQIDKTSAMSSIQKILDFIEKNKADLDKNVVDFYLKPTDEIYTNLTRLPFQANVQYSFETLGVDFDAHQHTVKRLDKIRQIFVHGKGHDTRAIANELYTHGKHTVTRNEKDEIVQMTLGQQEGLITTSYKMLNHLFNAYFDKY